MRTLLPLLATLLILGGNALAADLTQREWMVNLVDGLGWSFGLPDEPQDADYQNILAGNRRLRIEAEAHKQPTDMVSVKRYRSFGPFSGDGWVSGTAMPTSAHLRFLLPLDGTYRLSASLRLAGHTISVGDTTFRGDGDHRFTEVYLGELGLTAGEHEVVVEIPPNGAIDYLELTAPPLPPLAPREGWAPERPLSRDDLAVTTARSLGLETLLPPQDVNVLVETESAADLGGAQRTDIRHLGKPSGGSWVRAGTAPARVVIPFSAPAAGVYSLHLRGAAGSRLQTTLDGHLPLAGDFPSYLQEVPLGTVYLAEGPHTLQVDLPPRGGADSLTLAAHRSSVEDYRRLVGLPMGTAPPSLEEMNSLLALLAAIGVPR